MNSLSYGIGECRSYDGPDPLNPTVIVGPIRLREYVTSNSTKTVEIFVGCSMAFACKNPNCLYAQGRDEKRCKAARVAVTR